MFMQGKRVKNVQVFPYFLGISTDVEPVISGADGTYSTGQIMGSQFHRLELDEADNTQLHVGAAYSWKAELVTGQPLDAHWLYCTSVVGRPTFGAICDWTRDGQVSPLLAEPTSALIRLEELADITAILPTLYPDFGRSQIHLGKTGWLVMTTVTVPARLGILIESQSIPNSFAEGMGGIDVSAKSCRTMQSIGLSSLYFVKSGETALFLRSGIHP